VRSPGHPSRLSGPPWKSRRAVALRAATAVGLPLSAFVLAGQVQHGALASLGALAVLYAPGLPPRRRAARVFGVGVGLVLAMTAGTLVAGGLAGAAGVIAIVAGVAVLLARRRSMPPPGALMPVLVCATATQIPLGSAPLATRIGLVALGSAIAWIVAMADVPFRRRSSTPPAPLPPAPPWPQTFRAAARGAIGTGAAALVALMLGLPRPHWAAVACAAVLLHDASRETLRRAGHRAVGTAAGIGVAGLVLAVSPSALALVVLVVVLQFVVELVVARNYTLAVVFITPLALLQGALASGQLDGPVAGVLAGRLVETAIGCVLAVFVQAAIPPPGEQPVRGIAMRLTARSRPEPALA
jgi:hypothetical protein